MDCDQKLSFREAVEADQDLLLEWANEKETRRQSFQEHKITPEEHAQWFKNALRNDHMIILILCLGEIPVGNVRLLVEDTIAAISCSISWQYRGRGFSREMVKLAIAYAETHLNVSVIRAETKAGNIASHKMLQKNGFQMTEELPGQKVFVFSKKL